MAALAGQRSDIALFDVLSAGGRLRYGDTRWRCGKANDRARRYRLGEQGRAYRHRQSHETSECQVSQQILLFPIFDRG
jgi:hypothetical protein